MNDASDVLIDCQSLWKIFGTRAKAAVEAVKEKGLSKKQILTDFNCVVGVSDASLQVRRGEIFCIMGLSGSGKSTLIRLLNRLIEPSFGKILVKGRDISSLNAVQLREMRARNIGMVFQSVALLPHRTVLENAAFGLEVQGVPKDERYKTARAALDKVGLSDWTARYPSELSGGMQQRVGVARALANEPELMLMDEPLGALDALTRETIQELILDVWDRTGKKVFFITHSVEEALFLATHLIVMSPRPGRIVHRYELGFSRQYVACRDARKVKSDPEFIRLREEVLSVIQQRHERAA